MTTLAPSNGAPHVCGKDRPFCAAAAQIAPSEHTCRAALLSTALEARRTCSAPRKAWARSSRRRLRMAASRRRTAGRRGRRGALPARPTDATSPSPTACRKARAGTSGLRGSLRAPLSSRQGLHPRYAPAAGRAVGTRKTGRGAAHAPAPRRALRCRRLTARARCGWAPAMRAEPWTRAHCGTLRSSPVRAVPWTQGPCRPAGPARLPISRALGIGGGAAGAGYCMWRRMGGREAARALLGCCQWKIGWGRMASRYGAQRDAAHGSPAGGGG
jgi:hypothetical protein